MDRQIHITLTGRQRDEEHHETVTELSAEGEFYERNGSLYILYEEEADDGGRIKNILKLKGHLLELTRKGTLRTCMVFEPGHEHMADYFTPFGLLRFGVLTHEVNVLRTEDLMTITANYTLTESGRAVSHCNFSIKIHGRI